MFLSECQSLIIEPLIYSATHVIMQCRLCGAKFT